MSVADSLRRTADRNKKGLGELSPLYNEIVDSIQSAAKSGSYGVLLSMQIPEHCADSFPHIVGDLRGGDLVVDILSFDRIKGGDGYTMMLNITW